jgi:hypothetical protein
MAHAPDTIPWLAGVLVVVGGVLLPLLLGVARSRGLTVQRSSRD